MNERIALLALKASDPKTGWLDRQKFAELIVQEATNIVLHYTDVDEGVSVAKKHFGLDK
jgi:hypothetical protein